MPQGMGDGDLGTQVVVGLGSEPGRRGHHLTSGDIEPRLHLEGGDGTRYDYVNVTAPMDVAPGHRTVHKGGEVP